MVGDILCSIPVFSFVVNVDRGKYFLLTVCFIALHSLLLLVFKGNCFCLDKTNRKAAVFIFYRVGGDVMNRRTFGH